MIRIARGAEPEDLRAERRFQLARAILDCKEGKREFAGYRVAKQALARALNYKCVFCERDLHLESGHIEHFRPKASVCNDGKRRDWSRYWWLAWTWENLLFACNRCNTYKGDQFPLEEGTLSLPRLSFELERERPLLIDPSQLDPRSHIRFRWSEKRERWQPVPLSMLGLETINRLKLDADDGRTRHLRVNVDRWLKQLKEDMIKASLQDVQSKWRVMCDILFHKDQAYHSFTWDVLDHHFPAEVRRSWGLEMPVLGAPSTSLPPSPVFVDPPEMESLPEELKLRVRALGKAPAWEEVHPVLEAVLVLRDWKDAELARLFERAEATIAGWRRQA